MQKKAETQDLEFKPDWRDEHFKVICAFVNADGGNLMIGTNDNGNPIEHK